MYPSLHDVLNHGGMERADDRKAISPWSRIKTTTKIGKNNNKDHPLGKSTKSRGTDYERNYLPESLIIGQVF